MARSVISSWMFAALAFALAGPASTVEAQRVVSTPQPRGCTNCGNAPAQPVSGGRVISSSPVISNAPGRVYSGQVQAGQMQVGQACGGGACGGQTRAYRSPSGCSPVSQAQYAQPSGSQYAQPSGTWSSSSVPVASAAPVVQRGSGNVGSVLASLNAQRARQGLRSLRYDPQLQAVASQRAQRMAATGNKNHPPGSFAPGRYEGVGWSSSYSPSGVSACYTSDPRMSVAGAAMATGRDGVYFCVVYR